MSNFFDRLAMLLPVILLIIGATAVAAGVWLIYRPAGYITGGVLVMLAAVLMIRGDDDEHKT